MRWHTTVAGTVWPGVKLVQIKNKPPYDSLISLFDMSQKVIIIKKNKLRNKKVIYSRYISVWYKEINICKKKKTRKLNVKSHIN